MEPICIREIDGTRTDADIWDRVLERDPGDFVELKSLGGQGSGNFGHSGRPGEVGGAGEGGTFFPSKPTGHNIKKVDFGSENYTSAPSEMAESLDKTFHLGIASKGYYTKQGQEKALSDIQKIASALVVDTDMEFDVRVLPYMDSVEIRHTGLDKENPTNLTTTFMRDEQTGNLVVDLTYFKTTAQGASLAKDVLRSQFAQYEKLSVNRVELDANIDVGKYAWARFGFVPNSSEEARGVYQRAFDEMKKDGSHESRLGDLVENQLNKTNPDPEFIWQLSDDENGFRWLAGGSETESWKGTFSLKNERQKERLAKYLMTKSKPHTEDRDRAQKAEATQKANDLEDKANDRMWEEQAKENWDDRQRGEH